TDVRGVDKKLRHHPPTGEGEVTADLVASEAEESALIAAEINRIAGPEVPTSNGNKVPYSNIAILCRARRLFTRLEQRLREENIPVEVVGLGGLLATPEVVDLLAYLKVIAAPGDNISFARVAMGPRWRVHYRDLAALARWAATNTGQLQQQLEERDRIGEVDPGEERFSLLEAAARIDEIDDISGEARDRLRALHSEIERMRGRLRGVTLAEAIEQVLSSSGIEDELLVAGTPVAEAARANLSSFLDRASAFSPLEGEASLTAFLNWVDAAREAEDLEIAQPQQENSVKLMTVHQAKGLEFDVVFVPGMTDKSFPDTRVTDNPLKSVSEIPYWIREDRKYLPRIDFVKARFEEALKVRAMQEERRLAYVAFTRAKKALHISAAYWYGERATPGAPGLFFIELAGAPATEEREARPAHEAVTVGRRDEAPETNPMRDEWERRAEQWPPQDESVRDALFELGGRRVLEQALADPSVVDTLVAETEVDLTAYEKVRSEIAGQLELLPAPAAPPAADERLRSLSVSSIVQLARCPKQFYWTVVRPLPRRPSAAARLGHDIHRWIEIRSIGQGRLDDPEDLPDLTPEELEGDGGTGAPPASWATELKRSFEHSRFAAVMPRFTEQPFTLALPGGLLVRGRIDAVYVHDYATWELVDYKTGREPDADDEVARLQLSIYALAARRIWGVRPEQLTATYFYLKTGRAEPISGTDLITQESDLVEVFKRIEAGRFDPQPGRICNSCDFLRFCGAGRAYMAAQGAP
nr:PD-(D/E)XK nuclease family protein [Actinomycetota bacterium]